MEKQLSEIGFVKTKNEQYVLVCNEKRTKEIAAAVDMINNINQFKELFVENNKLVGGAFNTSGLAIGDIIKNSRIVKIEQRKIIHLQPLK